MAILTEFLLDITISSTFHLWGGGRFGRRQETAFLVSAPRRYNPSRYIWKRLPVTVIWLSILTILRKTRGLWIVYASLSYCSGEDCTGLSINFWSVSFLIFLFLALADLSMGKKGALGKIFRITSRTLVFYNARLPKLLLKLMRKKIQTNETEQKQLKHRILVNL